MPLNHSGFLVSCYEKMRLGCFFLVVPPCTVSVCVRVCARSPRLHQVCPMLLGPALRVTSRSNGDLAPCICCVPSAQVTKSDPNNNKTRLLCILELLLKAEAKARPSPPAIYASWADVASAAKTSSIFGASFAALPLSMCRFPRLWRCCETSGPKETIKAACHLQRLSFDARNFPRGTAAVTNALTSLRVCESKEAAEALLTTKAPRRA